MSKWTYLAEFTADDIEDIEEPLQAAKELLTTNATLLEALEAIRDIQSPVGGASYEVADKAIRKASR